jgi:hypothetical protein
MNSYKVRFNKSNQSYTTAFGTWVFFTFGRIVGEDVDMQHLQHVYCERILLWFWWGLAVIINALYTSVLVSLLVIVKYEPVVHSLDELTTFTNDYRLCLDKGEVNV